MALLADMIKGNLAVAAALGTTAVVLPKVMPHLSPQLRVAVRAGVSLFLESQSEAETGIVERLAGNALKDVLDNVNADHGLDPQGATAAIETFKRTARRRARRTAGDGPAHTARYQRHIAALRRALAREQGRHSGPKAAALQQLSASLDAA